MCITKYVMARSELSLKVYVWHSNQIIELVEVEILHSSNKNPFSLTMAETDSKLPRSVLSRLRLWSTRYTLTGCR